MTDIKDIPEAPEWLGDIAKDEWRKLYEAVSDGHFQAEDHALLSEYCEAIETSRIVTQQWKDEGCPVTHLNSNGTLGTHPLWSAKQAAQKQIAALATKLRVCPYSRKAVTKTQPSALDEL
ncbi:phage terminase small subunit P27 family [Cerasicoccus frondis]|uniref:phage terminase small subunit P27 family n=1 Tax=Cerasicoccus frondis TaxID=490090 RepID=UPI002852C277|nr:phage terminase small subunit P27 family [Cerasicoccus frondis]